MSIYYWTWRKKSTTKHFAKSCVLFSLKLFFKKHFFPFFFSWRKINTTETHENPFHFSASRIRFISGNFLVKFCFNLNRIEDNVFIWNESHVEKYFNNKYTQCRRERKLITPLSKRNETRLFVHIDKYLLLSVFNLVRIKLSFYWMITNTRFTQTTNKHTQQQIKAIWFSTNL